MYNVKANLAFIWSNINNYIQSGIHAHAYAHTGTLYLAVAVTMTMTETETAYIRYVQTRLTVDSIFHQIFIDFICFPIFSIWWRWHSEKIQLEPFYLTNDLSKSNRNIENIWKQSRNYVFTILLAIWFIFGDHFT